MKLYPDQVAGKKMIVDSIRAGKKRIVFSAPVSYGKTVIMANITEGAIKKGNRVWIIVDNIELINQTRETLLNFGIESHVIQGNHEDTYYPGMVQVATAQTLNRRLEVFKLHHEWLPNIVLEDEIHIQYSASKFLKGWLKDVIFIGMSATPTSKGLGIHWDELIVPSTIAELTASGRMSPAVYYACHSPDMKGVKLNTKGDYLESAAEEKVNTKTIRGDIVSNWLRLGENRKTIVFCINVKHSIDVANAFADAGINTAQLDGHTHKEMRKQIIKDFANDEIKVLTSVGVLIKGFDDKTIGCICMCRPTRSLSLYVQSFGRGVRKNNKHADCIVLDFAGNVERLGFADEYDPNSHGLSTGEKGDTPDRKDIDDPLPKPCPKCKFIKPPKTPLCPNCNYETETQANVVTESGNLKKLERTPAQKRHKAHTKQFKGEVYGAFLDIASKGHAGHLYKAYYGVWPKGLDTSMVGEKARATAKAFKTSQLIAYHNKPLH